MRLYNILILSAVLTTASFGQQLGIWKNYTDMKYVSDAVESQGEIWAATKGGVFKFNPGDSSYFTLTKSEGLGSQSITSIAVDASEQVWSGTIEGIINVYDPNTGHIKKILDIFNSNKNNKQINDIMISGDTVFVSTDFGISIINSETYAFTETITKFGDLPAEIKINSVTKFGLIYVSTDQGIAIQKEGATNLSAPESWQSYPIVPQIPVKVLKFQDTLYAATTQGLLKFDGLQWVPFLYDGFHIHDLLVDGNSIISLLVNTIHIYQNSSSTLLHQFPDFSFNKFYKNNDAQFIVSTVTGILEISTTENRIIHPESPASNTFPSIAVDNGGSIWSASGRSGSGNGVYKFDQENWSNFNTSNSPELESNNFHNAYAAPDNTLYFSNWGRGFTRYKDGMFETFNASNTDLSGIPDDPNFVVVWDIRNDSNNNTWILNYWSLEKKPLSIFTPDNVWYHYDFELFSISDNALFEHFIIDQFNTKWFSITRDHKGLYYFNENQTLDELSDDDWGVIKESDGLRSNDITALAVDNRGEIWIGTNIGVNIISDPLNPKSRITSVFSLRQQTITSIAVDPLNRKWIGTLQGVFLVSPDGINLIQQYDISNSPLPSNEIKSIAIDINTGIVYIGTDFGMSSLTTSAIQPVESFSELFVYPNPLIMDNENSVELTIDGLIKDSEIKVLSIGGKLIKNFVSPGGRITVWDGKDMNGDIVPSGIYIIVAYDSEANDVATAKVAVLKK